MADHARGVRLVIGKDKQTLTAQEMRGREVLRIARIIVRLEKERRKVRKRLKEIATELRIMRRAHKVVLAPVFTPDEVVGFDSATINQEKS